MSDKPEKDQDTPPAKDERTYWLDKKRNVDRIFWLLCLVCGLLALANFFYHAHGHYSVEEFPVFYGIYGFICFVFIVFAGKALRRFVMRDEDYYDDD